MAVSAPHDPPIRAGHAASPLQPDSRATHAAAPCFLPQAGVHIRFAPERKITVPTVVSSRLSQFEPRDIGTRHIEVVVKVASEFWSEKAELTPASRARCRRLTDLNI